MLMGQTNLLHAHDLHQLMLAHEVIDRLDVAEVLCHHLKHRRETRWPGWQTRSDFPQTDAALDCFVETVRDPATGQVKAFTRPYEQIVSGDRCQPTLDGKF
jgi:adenylylsulfate reductase subunit A